MKIFFVVPHFYNKSDCLYNSSQCTHFHPDFTHNNLYSNHEIVFLLYHTSKIKFCWVFTFSYAYPIQRLRFKYIKTIVPTLFCIGLSLGCLSLLNMKNTGKYHVENICTYEKRRESWWNYVMKNFRISTSRQIRIITGRRIMAYMTEGAYTCTDDNCKQNIKCKPERRLTYVGI
jgi:hypothetical protein